MGPGLNVSSALDASLDTSKFLAMTADGRAGSCQERSQVRLSRQVSLDLQDQPLELVVIFG